MQSAHLSIISAAFRRFYRERGRDFPWRHKGTTPFGILVVEMLLRQTKASQVAVVWPLLLERYPGPKEMAAADPGALFEMLAPLGLGKQRTKSLQEMSTALVKRHRGSVPRKIEALSDLPHVGLYAAHATACFAFGQRVPLVDANVLRVLGRIFGKEFKPDNRRSPEAWELAEQVMPPTGSAKEHNYGILDFSALICTPRKPLCRECPLNGTCAWCHEHVWSKVDFSQRPPSPPPWPR
jgi:A/G-specific adenine glycosylase